MTKDEISLLASISSKFDNLFVMEIDQEKEKSINLSFWKVKFFNFL